MLTRRQFLVAGSAATAAIASASAPANAGIAGVNERSIYLHNVHTGEALKTIYWARGHYDSGALQRLNHLLRDHYSDEVHRMDPRLIDLLNRLQGKFGVHRPFEVFSAYRSPETNAMLAMNGEGVAAHSLHMKGMAVDIRLPGTGLRSLRHAARSLRMGGVGSYRSFVHVDVGAVRYW